MANIVGKVNITSGIAPVDTNDTFPTHEAIYGKGGYRTVANLTERNSIPAERRELGMLVITVDTNVIYKLINTIDNTGWVELTSAATNADTTDGFHLDQDVRTTSSPTHVSLTLTATSSSTAGNIFKGADRFLHNYGTSNTFLGVQAGNFTMTGTNNTVIGYQALFSNTTGFYNTTNGYNSLYLNTTGTFNTANGSYSLYNNTTGNNNVANGYNSLYFNTTGTNNTANGSYSLQSNTTGTNNTANGYQSLYYNRTGTSNTANGAYSLYGNITGIFNTANGFQSLNSNIGGNNNTANGYNSLYLNTTGHWNTANGSNSLYSNETGNSNTANGYYSLYSNTIGYNNTANGICSLNANTTGHYNTANGSNSLYSNETGFQNTANGSKSLYSNTTGTSNTAMGYYSGHGDAPQYQIVADTYMTLIGNGATKDSASTLTNSTAIGNTAMVTKSNQVVLGNTSVTETLLNGNVGIGGITPTEKLSVSGNINVTGTIVGSNLSGVNTGDQTISSLGGQSQLNGTGFVKTVGTTISYDNSVYSTDIHANITDLNGITSTLITNWNTAFTNNHTHSNKTLLDAYTQTEVNLADAVAKKHTHSNITDLNGITSTLITNWNTAYTNNHIHSNKAFLDTVVTTTLVTGLNADLLDGLHSSAFSSTAGSTSITTVGTIGTGTWNATAISPAKIATDASNRFVTDTQIANWGTAFTNNHTHSNKALLDAYTQTEVNLSDAVAKKHTHANITDLNGITSSLITNWNSALHTETDPIFSAWNKSTGISITESQISDLKTYIQSLEKGASNGVATLDSGGKILVSQLPTTLMDFRGVWNASTNIPSLSDGAGNSGDVYLCSVSGTTNFGSGAIIFLEGDWVVYNGSIWQKSINSNSVVSVNGYQGVVSLNKTDVGLSNVDNTTDLLKPISTATQTALDLKWALNGNTVGAKKTIGSADNYDFGIITNNSEKVTILTNGNVGIGTTSPSTKLDVAGITNTIGLTSVQSQDTATTVELNIAPDAWICGAGWSLSGAGTYTKATGSLNTLDYSITTTVGDRIIISWAQTAGNTGYLTPQLGTVQTPQGQIAWWNNKKVDLTSNVTGTVVISFVPSSDYDGTINNISIKKLTSVIVANLIQKDTTGQVSLEIRSNKNLANQGIGYQSLYYNTIGTNNTANGFRSLYKNTTGYSNTANGVQSLYYNTTGYYNAANGFQSLYSNTTGNNNTANGYQSLYYNTTGANNTANGYQSLRFNTTGHYNTANGYQSLQANTTGGSNTANGYASLYSNTTGEGNTANGYASLYLNTTGSYNTANGVESLYSNTTGYNNTANGYASLYLNTTGANNTANGYNSLYNNTTGNNNTANGYNSLYLNTTGHWNTANGYQSLYYNTTGTNNISIGSYSGYNSSNNLPQYQIVDDTYMTLIGNGATKNSATTLTNSTAIGNTAMVTKSNQVVLGNTSVTEVATSGQILTSVTGVSPFNVTSTIVNTNLNADLLDGLHSTDFIKVVDSSPNIFINGVGQPVTDTGQHNTVVGPGAFTSDTDGWYNTAIGYLALSSNTTGGNNTAVGRNALQHDTNSLENTAIGCNALIAHTLGHYNTAVGSSALAGNLTGTLNCALGKGALCNTLSSRNTAMGINAGELNTTGSSNTFLGSYAGEVEGGVVANRVVTDSTMTMIGANASKNTTNVLSNSTALGYNALVTKSNQVVLGNTSVTETLLNGNLVISKGLLTTNSVISTSDIDWSNGTTFSKTLTANATFTFSNTYDGQVIKVAITNTTGNFTVTWPTIIWKDGVTPVQTVGAKTDIYTFVKIGANIYGSASQNY